MTTTTNFSPITLESGTLRVGDKSLLSGVPESVSLLPDPSGIGAFLQVTAQKPDSRHVFALGDLEGIAHWTCGRRYEPFWMRAEAGTTGGQVPIETQYLLGEAPDGNCVLFVPLFDGAFRSALQGAGENGLELVAESNDIGTVGKSGIGLFIASGPDPYELCHAAAKAVCATLGAGRLRRDKSLPPILDTFGWCTWDAFYQDVNHDKVREGLESFKVGGVQPKYLILDDGWQSIKTMPSGERRLTAFAANEKFPGDLGPTVRMTKQEYGIETFWVWHAFNGYWGGTDGDSLPGYDVHNQGRNFSPGIYHYCKNFDNWWGKVVGVVSPDRIYKFFQDYHRHLRQQGVDGVKVDNQAALEGLATGLGGRVNLMQRYHEALEGSVHTHFGGNLINCMSCANEMLYSALNSNLTRTSTDFWPNLPESHGQHLYINAQVSQWFGEWIHPDWDMFQSGHEMGAFHAAGRAVSGGPVYVSDKPDAHDFDLLRKLVLPNGEILRCTMPGRPTRDCLFADPTKDDVLLKIFNYNGGATAGIIGAFHAKYVSAPKADEDKKLEAADEAAHGDVAAESGSTGNSPNTLAGGDTTADSAATLEVKSPPPTTQPIAGSVSPSDIPATTGERFAVYAHYARDMRVMGLNDRWEVTLNPLTAEIFTFVPIFDGIAPIGLPEMFNSAGAITHRKFTRPGVYEIGVKGNGRFLAYMERRPASVTVNGAPLEFAYDEAAHTLECTLPDAKGHQLELHFAQ